MTEQCTTLSTAHTGGIKCTYTWQWMRNEREKSYMSVGLSKLKFKNLHNHNKAMIKKLKQSKKFPNN